MKKESRRALLCCELVVATLTSWRLAGDGGGLDWASARNFILGQDSKMEGSKWHAKKESVYYQAGDAGEGYSEDWQSDWGPAYYEEPDDEGKRVRPGPSFILLLLWSAIHRHHHHPGQSPRKGRKGKGHGRKGGSGKGKQGPLPLGAGGKAAARGRAANVGRQVCLRCGVAGHWARYCPSAATDKKRKLEGAEDEVMMVSEVTLDDTCKDTKVAVFAMDCDDNDDDTQVCTTVQDGGAASVLGSMLHVRRYLRSLLETGLQPGRDWGFPVQEALPIWQQ